MDWKMLVEKIWNYILAKRQKDSARQKQDDMRFFADVSLFSFRYFKRYWGVLSLDDFEEIVSDLCLNLLRMSQTQWETITDPHSYIFDILKKRIADYCRKKKMVIVGGAEAEYSFANLKDDAASEDTDHWILQKVTYHLLQQESLKKNNQAIQRKLQVWYFKLQGASNSDIAERIGINRDTIGDYIKEFKEIAENPLLFNQDKVTGISDWKDLLLRLESLLKNWKILFFIVSLGLAQLLS